MIVGIDGNGWDCCLIFFNLIFRKTEKLELFHVNFFFLI